MAHSNYFPFNVPTGVKRITSTRRLPSRLLRRPDLRNVRIRRKTTVPKFPTKDVNDIMVENFTIPGVNKVFGSNYSRIGKTIWACIIFVITISCMYQLGRRVEHFLDEPISTRLFSEERATFDFPAVTLCPFAVLTHNENIVRLQNQFKTQNNVTETPVFYELLRLPNITVEEIWGLAGLHYKKNIKAAYVHCHIVNKRNCFINLISKEIPTYIGTCLTLILNGTITYEGTKNGFDVIFNGYNNIGFYQTISVMFHESTFDPRHSVYKDTGLTVLPRYVTNIVLKFTEYKKADTKVRRCMPKVEYWNCTTKCFEDNVVEKISCKLPYITAPNLKMCTTEESARHTYTVTEEVYENLEKLCSYCYRPCHAIRYNVVTDVITHVRAGYTKLMFSVGSNSVDIVQEETPYDIVMLLGDLGGTLGFFMGLCILNAIEMLESAVVAFLAIIKKTAPLKL